MFSVRSASQACSENKVEDRMMSAALGGGKASYKIKIKINKS